MSHENNMSFTFDLLEITSSLWKKSMYKFIFQNKESENVIGEPLIPVRHIYFVKAGVVMCKGAEMIEI